jgi:hypothetical protein
MEDVKPYTDPKGRVWRVFNIEFESPEGKFHCKLWAISWLHAELQLEALKETGKVAGELQSRGR